MNLKNKKIAILGIAHSGLSAAKKIKSLGGIPFLSEKRPINKLKIEPRILMDFEYETGGHSEKILNSDLIVISPGVPIDIPILFFAMQKSIPIWSELELGYQIAKNSQAKIIAVTGSNGKSTTATLIYHILKNAGRKVILAGNIGKAFTSFQIERNIHDFIVLEVSSFQLDCIFEFKPDISIILNITPDHLDRYENFDEYIKSKAKIVTNQTEDDFAIINYDDSVCRNLVINSAVTKEFFSMKDSVNQYVFVRKNVLCISFPKNQQVEIAFDKFPIRGFHNVSNIVVAALCCQHCGLSADEIAKGILSFSGLEHRLEAVATINEIQFINDSKATNSASVRAALQSFDAPINLIMGGSNKNEDFSPLIPYIKKFVRNLVVFGETRDILHYTFSKFVNTYIVDDMKKAIEKSYSLAKKGDYVLLSPGCASFDAFKNFEDRGRKFKEFVLALQKEILCK